MERYRDQDETVRIEIDSRLVDQDDLLPENYESSQPDDEFPEATHAS